MNLVELIRTVCDTLGFSRPNSVIASNDRNVKQLSAILSQLGCDLVTQFDWQALYREHILTTRAVKKAITTVAGNRTINVSGAGQFDNKWLVMGGSMPPLNSVLERLNDNQLRMKEAATETGTFEVAFHQYAYPLPSDWHRQVPQTEWNKNNQGPLTGPRTPQIWQQYKSGTVYPAIGNMFRFIGNSIQILPPAPDGLTFSFEYISKNWVLNNSESYPLPMNDQDTFVFSDSLLMTGLIARWFGVHGLDSTIEKGEFKALLQMAKAQDKSGPALNLVSGAPARDLIPEGNWSF